VLVDGKTALTGERLSVRSTGRRGQRPSSKKRRAEASPLGEVALVALESTCEGA
jgi:hypothetical protein